MKLALLLLFSWKALALPGFYTADKAQIPAKVKEAGKSVFSLIVLSEDEKQYPEFFTHVLNEKYLLWSKSPDAQTRRVAQVAKAYFDHCKSLRQALCRAPLKTGAIAGGSGILIGPGGTELWTAGHVFEEPFRQALQSLSLNDVQDLVRLGRTFKTIIFDSEGRLVAHPFNNKLKLVYSASGAIVPRANPETKVDNIKFELEKPIGRGLEIAPAIKPGENIYSVGYPACTGCAATYGSLTEKVMSGSRFPHPDAGQFDQQFTLGQVLGLDGNLINTDADANGGMSGGAALDEEGRVLGINSAVGFTIRAPSFAADRRLRLSRPTVWAAES
jgi:hypothetical protein